MSSSVEGLANFLSAALLVGGACLVLWLYRVYSYWAVRGVPYVLPVPFFGNSFRLSLSITHYSGLHQKFYQQFGDSPYGGIWEFLRPILMVKDPELIEHILVKDFSTFIDREFEIDMERDATAKNLVNMKGDKWRALRNKLTPVFSAGKLKRMLPLILECSDVFVKYLEGKVAEGKPLEIRDEVSGFATDVIASCAFGLSGGAVHDPESTFRKIGKAVFNPCREERLRQILIWHFGSLVRVLGIRVGLPKPLQDFFISTVKDTVKSREEKGFRREDFIQLMIDVKKKEEAELKKGATGEILMDDKTITSSSLAFLIAGYETTGTTLGCICYELSQNQDVQERLYKEVVETLDKHNGQITWDAIKDMNYLEQVVFETMRKHPPVPYFGRQSVRPYRVPHSDLELPAGSVVYIPIHSLHHDPKYFPNPSTFDPERFSIENQDKLVKCTFLPFGGGPRICIGMRFALLEIKVLIVQLMPRYRFKLNPKTISPLQYTPQSLFLNPVGGVWIDFIPRTPAQ